MASASDFYGQTAAAAIGPVLIKAFGKNRKAAFMTPDYTYGHTVTKSVSEYLAKNGGWTTVTDQVSPLGAPDYSSYLTNIANSGAEFLINVNWGHDAVLSTQQAKQFGILDKMKLVIPYQIPFLAKEVGAGDHAGRLRGHRFLVDAGGQVSDWRRCSSTHSTKSMATSRNGVRRTPTWNSPCGQRPWRTPVPSTRRRSSSPMRPARKVNSIVGEVYWRAADHQLVRPVIIVRGKKPSDMKNKEDFWEVLEVVPGLRADAGAGCLRLPPRRLYLTAAVPLAGDARDG